MKIHLTDRIKPEEDFIILVQDMEKLNQTPLSEQEQEYVRENYVEGKRETFFFNRLSQLVFVRFLSRSRNMYMSIIKKICGRHSFLIACGKQNNSFHSK